MDEDETGRRFLCRFQERERSVIGNLFLEVIRAAGETEPTARDVCSQVFWEVSQRAKDGDGTATRWLGLFREHKEEALAAAAWFLAGGEIPPADAKRGRPQQTDDEQQQRAYMATQAPTEKQLALLKRLKHTEVPANRLEASDLITQLKDW